MTVRDVTIEVPDRYPLHPVNDYTHRVYTYFMLLNNNVYFTHVL